MTSSAAVCAVPAISDGSAVFGFFAPQAVIVIAAIMATIAAAADLIFINNLLSRIEGGNRLCFLLWAGTRPGPHLTILASGYTPASL